MKATITLTTNGEITADEWQQFVKDFVARSTPHLDRHAVSVEFAVRTGQRVSAGAGGAKGQQVLAYLQAHPELGRKQVAEACGCSVARVGEVMRAAGIVREKPAKVEPAPRKGKKAQEEPKAATKPEEGSEAPAADPELEKAKETFERAMAEAGEDGEVRHEKCEHERKAKKRAGTCTKGCPPYVEPVAA